MQSPFPKSASFPGRGDVHLSLLPPSTPVFSSLLYTYPLKLLPSHPHTLDPKRRSLELDSSAEIQGRNAPNHLHKPLDAHPVAPSSVPLLFILTYGGGLLAGDCIDLTIRLDPYTRLATATQGSTKVYKNPSLSNNLQQSRNEEITPTISAQSVSPPKFPSFADLDPKTISRQDLQVYLGIGAALWIGPDPIQPFKGSRFAQKQIFEVERGGSVGLVDWVTEGRRARGETWQMDGWRGRNEIWDVHATGQKENIKGNIPKQRILLIRDSLILQPSPKTGTFPSLSSHTGVIGTILLHGPLFTSLSTFFLSEFAALPRIGARNWATEEETQDQETKLTDHARWRKGRLAREKADGLLWTAARVRGGVTVVKFSAREVGGARGWLGDMFREEGGVVREFGPGGMVFVK